MQVGVVLLSILCHIWKIVPDLYEAITGMQGDDDDAAVVVDEDYRFSDEANGTGCFPPQRIEEVGGLIEKKLVPNIKMCHTSS